MIILGNIKFFKGILSILNSIPFIYTLLSSNIFFFLNKFNPRVYRKIIYSGMGIKEKTFDPNERNDLSKYQIDFGICQLEKYEIMKTIKKYEKNEKI